MREIREILFRGKCCTDGKWVEGYLGIEVPDELVIQQFSYDEYFKSNCIDQYSVKPETVGQYTGLTDKNGTKIFEGDIIKITGFHTTAIAAVKYGSASEKSTHWGWYFDDNDGHTYFLMSKAFCEDYNAIIIGNIHDNPELMGGNTHG